MTNFRPTAPCNSLRAFSVPNGFGRIWIGGKLRVWGLPKGMIVGFVVMLTLLVGVPDTWSQVQKRAVIRGRVLDSAGRPVPGASVRLEGRDGVARLETTSDLNGEFGFSGLAIGAFSLVAEKATHQSAVLVVVVSESGDPRQLNLILNSSGPPPTPSNSSAKPAVSAMEFADNPSFIVAGVTDWTAAGGHGSDANLRASEALNRETLTLGKNDASQSGKNSTKNLGNDREASLRAALAGAPVSFEANHRLGEFYLRNDKYDDAVLFLQTAFKIDPGNAENEVDLAQACEEVGDLAQARKHVEHLLETSGDATVHRLAGEIAERTGDPLAAVHEYERAVRIDPSEQNYFEWGSELLIHRAVWQAKEVFEQGVKIYPNSVRLLTSLGAALFAGALYDEAARRLCEASDLDPENAEPYVFMGKVEIAAPNPLPCVAVKLARFVQMKPENARAQYYLAMALWKQSSADEEAARQVESMLLKAVALDPKFSDPYTQLGILSYSHGDFVKAADFYARAIDIDPRSSEAHYRLGMACDRLGERDKAKQEFQLHEDIEKQRAAEVDRERREVKQFVVEVPDKPIHPAVQ